MLHLFGKLTPNDFKHDIVVNGGVATMILAALTVIFLLTYFKRWKWLWTEWLTSVDPKRIGMMYIIVASVMLLRGIGDAVMMRLQQVLAAGHPGYLAPEHYQEIFTAHGTIMIFFVAMGFLFGALNLIVPLQIGARDVAFPFMNSASFWLYAMGALLMNISLAIGEPAATGWLAYPPLSELQYSPGAGVDYWIWAIQISGIGSLLSGVNFIATIIKMRAPGMTLTKMPVFVWTSLASMSLVVFAFPILTATLAMLSLDRTFGMHFFTATGGGNAMMYVNLIWAWGHPEVYILILPAFGVYSEIVATYSQKRLFGYMSMVYAIAAIALLSFLVWLHHFFTMGAGADVNAFFGMMTAVISVPTGVKVFNWLFTMYKGRIKFGNPLLWFLGFVATFTVGGMAGVLMSIPSVDFQIHNSLFLVAHFHTMIVGGVLFGVFAGYEYWFPKFAGYRLNEKLGRYAFWFWITGFLMAFIPLYILGIMGATRRLDHYDPAMGWQWLFGVAGVGVLLICVGVGFQILQLIVSYLQRDTRRDLTGDPWNGRTLEWATTSPPQFYNFAVTPQVTDRDQFWADKLAETPSVIEYEDIHMPKNTPMGFYIGIIAFIFGFSVVWHILWLIPIALLGIIGCIVWRFLEEDTEYVLKANTVKRLEEGRHV